MQTVKRLEDFGASPSSSDNSEAFARALSFFQEVRGGVLQVGRGTWSTGPIRLCSSLTLELEEGCVLSFIPESDRYRPVKTRWEGVVCYAMQPCIFADGEKDVCIRGKGVIDGNGSVWWEQVRQKRGQQGPLLPIERELAALNPGYESQPGGGGGRASQFLRPALLQFHECSGVKVEGVRLQNSPFWTLHPLFCTDVLLKDLDICNPPDAPNTDGMDIDSCDGVRIESCRVNVGDDGIAIKSGSGEDGIRCARPARNISIRNCVVGKGHGGVTLGSEIAGGVEDVRVEGCRFEGTDRGIRIKTRRGRGGWIKNISLENLTMEGNLCPIAVNMYYRCGADVEGKDKALFSTEACPLDPLTPSISNISIRHVRAEGCRASAGFIAGLPEAKLTGFELSDSVFTVDEGDSSPSSLSEMYAGLPDAAGKSFRIVNAENPKLEGLSVRNVEPEFLFN